MKLKTTMKLKFIIPCLTAVLLSASAAFAQTIATWTFETSQPSGTIAANSWATNIVAEVPTGTGSAFHKLASSASSSPAGNGSAHSYNLNNWSVGDCFQFAVSTVNASNIIVSFDSISSSTGPRDFNFQYSTDGVTFTTFTTFTNGNSPGWSASSVASQYTHLINLLSVTALNNASVVYFRLTCADTISSGGGTTGASGTTRVDNFSVTTETPPTISSVSPATLTANAGTTATFTATLSAGTPPFTYLWYTNTISSAHLISTVTTNITTNALTLPNVLAANSGNYFVVVTNASGVNATNTSAITLSVIDPAINYEPVNQTNFPGGEVQFNVTAGGTGLSYQWFYCTDPSDNTKIAGAVNNGPFASGTGAGASGATTSALTITNLTTADPTNFVVIVTGTFGAVTSSVASFAVETTQVPLAIWNFNNPIFNVSNPAPYQGIGTASSTNVTPLEQPTANADPDDSLTPNMAWGTENYPAATVSNKQAGVQFNVSTLGAKDINVSYDIRGSGTASKYHRLQYTTNGTAWIDYPTSSSVVSGGTSTSIYTSFSYNLTGFPGVANNTNFGIRMVSEFESTASYGATNDSNYVAVGTTATYNPVGTLSYDLVTITGDAITNANQPPTITPASLPNVAFDDSLSATNIINISDDTTPANLLVVAATSPTSGVNPTTINNNDGTSKVIVTSSLGNTVTVVAPVLVTVTDTNGDSTVAWFYATIMPANAPPTISGLVSTNMLTNTSLTISFTLADDHTDMTTVTPTVTSGNTALVPNTGLSLGGGGTTNRTLTITPAANQYGAVPITVSVSDSGSPPLTTSQTIYVEVRQSPHVVLVDNFTYDAGGTINSESGGLWSEYSGTANQMVAGSGVVTIDGVNNSEDVEAPLIGAPYPTNSATVLYSKYYINYSTLPGPNGSFLTYFTDGTTSNFVCRVWAFTNGAASGDYRLGIAISTNVSTSAVPFPQDLVPGTSYLVVSRLVLSNSASTLWINPGSETSQSVTATDTNFSFATQFTDYDLRESTADEGILTISNLSVGTTFNDVVGVSPADVSVVVTGPANVFAGSNLTYTVTVSNAGLSLASSAVATDSLPSGATFVSTSGGGVNNSGAVSWSFGDLATSATSNVTVTITAPASGPLTNTVIVSSSTSDPNLANNTNSVITTVAPIPVGEIVISGGAPVINWSVQPGVSYSILWSTNVAGPYSAITNSLTFGGMSGTFTDTVHTNLPRSFYRISSP